VTSLRRAWLAFLVLGCSESGQVLGPAPTAAPTPTDTTEPPPEPTTLAASQVTTGVSHSCALALGSIYCWGSNEFGQVGNGATADALGPELVTGTERYQNLCAGNEHTCGLTDLGEVFCWGNNQRGQLGQGDRRALSRAARVSLPGNATQVTCGFAHTCALLGNAEAWCWGQNGEGELGLDDPYPGNTPENADVLEPVRVGDATYRSIGPGDGHTCLVRSDGALFCTGRNKQHQLGSASDQIQERLLLRVGSDSDWVQVVSGQQYSCALRSDRTLWCWGSNTAIQSDEGSPLGIPAEESITPSRVPGGDWLSAVAHTFHTCAIARDANVWCWGRNAEGQLNSGDVALRVGPVEIGRRATSLDVGLFTTCLVDGAGIVSCAGKNDNGELGTGDRERRYTLTDVPLAVPE